ncbi:short chain dehydrogenase [Neocallimastix lanati (nom. inval.)]|uniref:Short chain dehydrogenase n=1 Tax=Neocallimastix californiae TaxID=1754190 RepID=A0A1Y2FKZ4_9FUNG|nr:short chain dehydrogenase [Neocallimastix sp. JGI-2020a]ORY84014.1 short chain dehydrogenase [Neocallimastix californiae]|eukprot:ORY84014.1 short chain dehydrogenase [Neocallimastix californiae]
MGKDVVVLLGAGSIGQAIARRVSYGKHLVIADIKLEVAEKVAKDLYNSGYETSAVAADLGSRDSILNLIKHAQQYGDVSGLICGAGVSPSQAPIDVILKVDLYGTSVLMEEFGKIIKEGGSGIIISSQSGHRLEALSQNDNELLALTPTEELLELDMLKKIDNTLTAYQYAKRCNVLRVAAESVKWGKRNARINSLSPGIIITPLANDELNGPRGDNYKKMINLCPSHRAGTPDEIGDLAAYLMSDKAGFISGSDFLIDGGTTASYWYGDLQYMRKTMGN